MSGIGMTVRYRSGTLITSTIGIIEQECRLSNGKPQYFVRWSDGRSGWYLYSNLAF